MSTRWAVWFAVSGDVRFLSHHDVMRLMERAATRAQLPLKYSQGFNPRPKLSLALPRPVGVASRCELMLIELDGQADAEQVADALGRQLPEGMKVLRAEPLPPGRPPRITSASYELDLEGEEPARVRKRLEALSRMEKWEVTRGAKGARRANQRKEETIDIRDRVGKLTCDGGRLSFALLSRPAGWAKCAELLALVGLPGSGQAATAGWPAAEVLARLRRTAIECKLLTARKKGRNKQA